MPKASRPAVTSGPSTTANSRKMIKVLIKRPPRKLSASTSPDSSTSPQPLRKYPWDSHQDDIVVNSVETPNQTGRLTGVEHYLQQLSLKKDYKDICIDFDEYRRNGLRATDAWDPSDEQPDEEQERYKPLTIPRPPPVYTEYEHQIYTCTTTNPTICLAIARIAQHNLPNINFQSAINHLPNVPLAARLPKLQLGVLAEDIPHERDEDNYSIVTVLFLPRFYHDGRHALGYYTADPPTSNSAQDAWRARLKDVRQMLFTPCVLEDLEAYGMIRYAAVSRAQDGIETGDASVQSIGARGGRWLQYDNVEDWDERRTAFHIVEMLWDKRLGVATGLEESSL
ncbi:hypothetical protein COCCADRAFT_31086 [Bipolaris zeicola 26-R-13]|uniref:Uncharacterized protein n=1 Tax=Cochliobolus carbonum (strain 26-R-13) TaxID=930089 RepID=W6XJT1_COCC2|nr:uncharacterized protein COCCADRAFT_31086 [Bipolaris zeicola 26-R-13]EUC27437.1 hypothetical protein COCCADRAFT_31086 [Bipolaris zeicola 26-R-13]